MKLYRPKRLINVGRPATLIRLAFGAYFISKYWPEGSIYWLALGVLWPLSLFFHLLLPFKPKLTFEETSDGFISMEGWSTTRIRWDQIVALGRGVEEHGKHLIVWRENLDGKEKFVAVTTRGVGDEGFQKVGDLIRSKRPNLPDFSGGKVQDT